MARELGWGFTHKLCYARCCACCFRLPLFLAFRFQRLCNLYLAHSRHPLFATETHQGIDMIYEHCQHCQGWNILTRERNQSIGSSGVKWKKKKIVRERDERQWKQIIGKCLFLWWMSSSHERICWFGGDESGNCWRSNWIGSDSRGLFSTQLRVWIAEQELDNELVEESSLVLG